MAIELALFQILLVVFLGVISISLAYIAWLLKRVFAPSIGHRLRVLEDRTEFNLKLLSEKDQERLKLFAYSEAALAVHIEDLAEKDAPEAKAITEDPSFLQKMRKWFSKGGELLVSKINDIAKSSLGRD